VVGIGVRDDLVVDLEMVVGKRGVGVKGSGLALAIALTILDGTVTTVGFSDSVASEATDVAILTGTLATTLDFTDSGVAITTVSTILTGRVATTVVSILGSELSSQATRKMSVVVSRSSNKNLYRTSLFFT
tara:strand:+ start:1630 stop:2022 length:393 start_codon:yes stop_codon:yes gene_type:complete